MHIKALLKVLGELRTGLSGTIFGMQIAELSFAGFVFMLNTPYRVP